MLNGQRARRADHLGRVLRDGFGAVRALGVGAFVELDVDERRVLRGGDGVRVEVGVGRDALVEAVFLVQAEARGLGSGTCPAGDVYWLDGV